MSYADDMYGGGRPLKRYAADVALNGVVHDAPAKLLWAYVYNDHATETKFLCFFDAATVPEEDTQAVDFVMVAPKAQAFIAHRPDVALYQNGLCWAVSTVPGSLTQDNDPLTVRVMWDTY